MASSAGGARRIGAIAAPLWQIGVIAAEKASKAEEAGAIEGRLADTAKYLSSDALEGRGVGTKGLDQAADYIAARFREIGLKTDLYDGGPFQKFTMTTGATLGSDNRLVLVGPPADGNMDPRRIEMKLGEDFTPLAIGGSGKFDLPLVFVGYGITAKDADYDDYAKVDVKDKAVVILRHEPQQANPHSVFDGTRNSQHAPFRRKVSNAYEHGAAAVIFCNDAYDINDKLASVRKRWQAAVDELADVNDKFKKKQSPAAAEADGAGSEDPTPGRRHPEVRRAVAAGQRSAAAVRRRRFRRHRRARLPRPGLPPRGARPGASSVARTITGGSGSRDRQRTHAA